MVARTRQQRWSQEQSQATAQIGEDSEHPERNLVRQQRDFDPMVQEMRERCVNSSSCRNIGVRASLSSPCEAAEEARQVECLEELRTAQQQSQLLGRKSEEHRRAMEDLTRRLASRSARRTLRRSLRNERSKSPGCTQPTHEPEDRDWRGSQALREDRSVAGLGTAHQIEGSRGRSLGQQTWDSRRVVNSPY